MSQHQHNSTNANLVTEVTDSSAVILQYVRCTVYKLCSDNFNTDDDDDDNLHDLHFYTYYHSCFSLPHIPTHYSLGYILCANGISRDIVQKCSRALLTIFHILHRM